MSQVHDAIAVPLYWSENSKSIQSEMNDFSATEWSSLKHINLEPNINRLSMFGDVWYARARRENIKLQRTQIKIELHQKNTNSMENRNSCTSLIHAKLITIQNWPIRALALKLPNPTLGIQRDEIRQRSALLWLAETTLAPNGRASTRVKSQK